MVLKAFYDLMSQPSRALVIFLRCNSIPFKESPVAIRKGEHFTEEYKKVNPFGKVPAIDDNGFTLTESSAILRYLADSYLTDANRHWYPTNLKLQAKVNEYLDWHQLNVRYHLTGFFQSRLIQPITKQKPIDVKKLESHKTGIQKSVEGIDSYFLQDRKFFLGEKISIGDLQAACEFEQVVAAGLDALKGHPRVAQWFERVKETTDPHYSEASQIIHEVSRRMKVKVTEGKWDSDLKE